MKVLFIYPAFPVTFWSFEYALKFVRKKAAYPPLGLLTVASMLPEDWDRRLVDMNVERLTDDDLRWADMVFIGGMAIQRAAAVETIARCKAEGLTVVAGGPLFTAEPDEFGQVDHFVLDEAELTLPEFLADFADGCARRVYRANAYCDLQQTPGPDWSLIRPKNYASMSIQFSRGCPFDCDFCNVTVLFGRKPRVKQASQILAELDSLYAQGWRGNIFFVDDNFIGNKRYLKSDLLPALIQWRQGKKGCIFYTEASINLADDPELVQLMIRAGFDSVFIGIESPEEESLRECGKNQNRNRNIIENVKSLQHAGLQVYGGFIVGFDHDTHATFQRLVDFIQNSGIVTAMVGLLQAPPGTRLFDRLKQENRLTGSLSGDNVDGTTNIVPKMGLESLMQGYRNIMAQIYAPKHYYRRVKTFLREFQGSRERLPMDLQRFLALFRSGLRLGILGRERFQFWYLMAWTLFRKPRHLPTAITLAIYGHHFRKICERYILV